MATPMHESTIIALTDSDLLPGSTALPSAQNGDRAAATADDIRSPLHLGASSSFMHSDAPTLTRSSVANTARCYSRQQLLDLRSAVPPDWVPLHLPRIPGVTYRNSSRSNGQQMPAKGSTRCTNAASATAKAEKNRKRKEAQAARKLKQPGSSAGSQLPVNTSSSVTLESSCSADLNTAAVDSTPACADTAICRPFPPSAVDADPDVGTFVHITSAAIAQPNV